MKNNRITVQQGFTLVEMAIVMIIFGVLLAAFLTPLQAQRSIAAQRETEIVLENAKQALLGYVQANGRLPCPATNNGGAFPDGTGTSNPNASGACAQSVGFLPATTLGLESADDQGFGIDAWNNRIRYAVTTANANAFTTTNAMNNLGIANLTPNLRVCASATGITATTCSAALPETNVLVSNTAAVIFSLGETGALASGGADENANLDLDGVFVSHDIGTGGANGAFDHLVTWISPYVVYNAMIQAGQLH